MHLLSAAVTGSVLAFAPAGLLAPPVNAEPPQPNAASVYCTIHEQNASREYGGYADPPTAQREDHKDAVQAEYHVLCNEPVTVFIHWTINGPQDYEYSSSPPINVHADAGETCTQTTQCAASYLTPKNKIGGSFSGHDLYQAAGTITIYKYGTLFEFGATPLQTADIKGGQAYL
jgi:hypothetical protein